MNTHCVVTNQDVITYRSSQDDLTHIGNQIYRIELRSVHQQYAIAQSEPEKTIILQSLIDRMINQLNARFLQQDACHMWHAMKDTCIEVKVYEDLNRKHYVKTVTERDVKMGRGGHCTSWAGNQAFLDAKDRFRTNYLEADDDKEAKRHIGQDLVDWVYSTGGRFLEQTVDRKSRYHLQWYVVSNDAARKKAMQALLEKRRRPTIDTNTLL